MIIPSPYWYDIVPAEGISDEVDGKWLIFGPTDALHKHLSTLDDLVEKGVIKGAKVARKDPTTDSFPHKPCVICIFTADDPHEKASTAQIVEAHLQLRPAGWKSNAQTDADWRDGGWLRLEAESVALRREIEQGKIRDVAAAQQRLDELAAQIRLLAESADTDDRRVEFAVELAETLRAPVAAVLGNEPSLADVLAQVQKLHALVSELTRAPNRGDNPPLISKDGVFVVMPFSEDYEDTYAAVQRAARSVRPDVPVHRADEIPGAIVITDVIHRSIEEASVVLCDLTAERPNVYYELGFARGKQKMLLCIAREGTTIHFDVSGLKILFFKTLQRLEVALARELDQLLPKEIS